MRAIDVIGQLTDFHPGENTYRLLDYIWQLEEGYE